MTLDEPCFNRSHVRRTRPLSGRGDQREPRSAAVGSYEADWLHDIQDAALGAAERHTRHR